MFRDDDMAYIVAKDIANLSTRRIQINYWIPGESYDPKLLAESKYVLFILPNGESKYFYNHFPKGMKKEIDMCLALNKRMLMTNGKGDYRYVDKRKLNPTESARMMSPLHSYGW